MNTGEPYYDEVSKSKEEFLPGESIIAAYGFTLDNENSPLIINFIDENKRVIGTKEISYSKELAENNPGQEIIEQYFSSEEAQSFSTNRNDHPQNGRNLEQETQDKFWEAKSWGWSDEQASAYAAGRDISESQPNKVVNSESDAVNLAISMYGDNNGDWN